MAELARSRQRAFGDFSLDRALWPNLQAVIAQEIDWQMVGYAALVIAAFTLRFWDVGGRAMHHDESLHATYAWYLFKGRGYQYNPLMHGPLQFYVMAFFYMLFGDHTTTARLFAVLCGSAIVALPYFMRRDLGTLGAAIAAVSWVISPAFLYYSRFARDDVYLDFFTLLMVVGFLGFLRSRRPRSLYLVAAAAALAMATMEASYIVFFIFGSFLGLAVLSEWLTLPFDRRPITEAVRSITVESWLWIAAIFLVITILLYSTFLTNPSGVFDFGYGLLSPNRMDILGGLTYWLSQHGVARGGQPWFYYLLLFPLYEPFAMLFALGGVFWAVVRRRMFTTFLALWFALALAIYSWAGEKMPWLFLHPLLPGILLAATFTGYLLERYGRVGRTALIGLLVVLALVEAHSAQALTFADGANPTEMLIYVQTSNDVPIVSNEVLGLVKHLPAKTTPPLIQIDDSDLQGWPFEWYFRNLPAADISYSSNFANPAAPILIMLDPEHDRYASSLQSRYVVSRYRWNWWFPEDYKGFTFDNGMCGTAAHETPCPPGTQGTVFLKTGMPCPPTALVAGSNCSLIQTPAAINLLHAITNDSTWRNLWDWYAYRTPFGQRGARMLYLYVRKDLVPASARTGTSSSGVTNTYHQLAIRSTLTFGNTGLSAGRLLDPHGLTRGANGDIYVADSGNHRISIYSPTRVFLGQIGKPGTGSGEFNINQSPMAVAVSPSGTIYATDWWNHRIEEFGPDGHIIRSWGHYGLHGPYAFFGPRAIALGPNRDVYVADTGNRQIAVFSPTGRFLFRFGRAGSAAGQFEEPSSVIAAPNGDIYVADMWNSRIQRFDAGGHYLGSWPVPSWQSQSYEEPYLAQLPNGNILATDPTNSRILEFTASGRRVGAISDSRFSMPIGVTAGPNGTIYVTDAANNDVIAFRVGRRTGNVAVAPSGSRIPKP